MRGIDMSDDGWKPGRSTNRYGKNEGLPYGPKPRVFRSGKLCVACKKIVLNQYNRLNICSLCENKGIKGKNRKPINTNKVRKRR